MEIYVDGASSGNPGLSGAGVVLVANGIYEQHAIPLGAYTNHEAEFMAVKLGLELACSKQPTLIRLYTDSKIVIESIEKRHAKNPLFKPLLDQILQLIDQVPLFFIEWKNVAQNKQADQLARQAIQKARRQKNKKKA
ncbi:ribonuclease HI family protein [Listeria costaricensis]|uniref:ribonuclease HI family protein n=1 Tax=Listeria costaricensis TaxID=2026604 RepID=UPI000C08D753|nr:ribonuclease HI family protein [Listeria costaricensis]